MGKDQQRQPSHLCGSQAHEDYLACGIVRLRFHLGRAWRSFWAGSETTFPGESVDSIIDKVTKVT